MERDKLTPKASQRMRLIIHIRKHDSPEVLSEENIIKKEENNQQSTLSSLSKSPSEILPTVPLISSINPSTTEFPSPTDTPPLPLTPPSTCFSLPPPTPPTSSPSLINVENDNNNIFDRERVTNTLKSKDSSIKEKTHSLKLLKDNINDKMSINYLSGIHAVLFKQDQILNIGKDILNGSENNDNEEFFKEYGRFSVATNYHRVAYYEKVKKNNDLFLKGIEEKKIERKKKIVGLKETSEKEIKKSLKKKEVIQIDGDSNENDEKMDFKDEDDVELSLEEESDEDTSYDPSPKRKAKRKADVRFIKK